jgi:hypothetical protein
MALRDAFFTRSRVEVGDELDGGVPPIRTEEYITWSTDLDRKQIRLGNALYLDPARAIIDDRRTLGVGSRIIIKALTPVLDQVPWEYARFSDAAPLVLEEAVSVIRRPRDDVPPPRATLTGRAVVAVAAAPGGATFTDLGHSPAAEATVVIDHLRRWGYEVEHVADATRETLTAALSADLDIFVFIGHGACPGVPGGGEVDAPGLVLVGDGDHDVFTAQELADAIAGAQLAALSCCYSAHEVPGAPGFRHLLGRAGVGAVIGMNGSIETEHSAGFFRTFFEKLGRGACIDQAISDGRLAVQRLARLPLWGHPCASINPVEPRFLPAPVAVGASAAPPAPLAAPPSPIDITVRVEQEGPAATKVTVRFRLPELPPLTVHRTLVDEIHEQFRDDERATRRIALTGDTGKGKTSLAARYIDRYQSDYDLIAWIPSETADGARIALSALIGELRERGTAIPGKTLDDQLESFSDYLQSNTRWLLVFDNVDRPADVEDLLPRARTGDVIITSQFTEWSALARTIPLERFTEEEARALLQDAANEEDPEAADALAALVDRIPLDVGIIAQDLASSQGETTLRSMLEQLQAAGASGYALAEARRDAFANVRLARAEEATPGATHAAVMAAVLVGEQLPHDLLDDLASVEAFGELVRHSLGRWNNGSFEMHRAIRDTVRRVRPASFADGAAVLAAASALSRHFPTDLDDPTTVAARGYLQPAASFLVSTAEDAGLRSTELAALATGIGLLLREQADLERARSFHERAQALLPDDEQANSAVRADILNNFGRIFDDLAEQHPWGSDPYQALRDQARLHYQQALDLDLDRDDPHDGRRYYRMNNLIRGESGAAAIQTTRDVVAGLERVHGVDWPDLHIPVGMLAQKLRNLALEIKQAAEAEAGAGTDDDAEPLDPDAMLAEAEALAARADRLAQGPAEDRLQVRRLGPLATLALLRQDADDVEAAWALNTDRVAIARTSARSKGHDPETTHPPEVVDARSDRGNLAWAWSRQLSDEQIEEGVADLAYATAAQPSTETDQRRRVTNMLKLASLTLKQDANEARDRLRKAVELAATIELDENAQEFLDRTAATIAADTQDPEAETRLTSYLTDHPEAKPFTRAMMTHRLGVIAMRDRDPVRALEHFREAKRIEPAIGNDSWILETALELGDHDALEDALVDIARSGAPEMIAVAANKLATRPQRTRSVARQLLQILDDFAGEDRAEASLLPICMALNFHADNLELAANQAWEVAHGGDELSRPQAHVVLDTVLALWARGEPTLAAAWYERQIADPQFTARPPDARYRQLSRCIVLAEQLKRGDLWNHATALRKQVFDEIIQSGQTELLWETMRLQISQGNVADARRLCTQLIEIRTNRGEWDEVAFSIFTFASALGQVDRAAARAYLADLPPALEDEAPAWWAKLLADRAQFAERDDPQGDEDLAAARSFALDRGLHAQVAIIDTYLSFRCDEDDEERADAHLRSAIEQAERADQRDLVRQIRLERIARFTNAGRLDVAEEERQRLVQSYLEEGTPARAANVYLDQAHQLGRDDVERADAALEKALGYSDLALEPDRSFLGCAIHTHAAWLHSRQDPVAAVRKYRLAADAGQRASGSVPAAVGQELQARHNAVIVTRREADAFDAELRLEVLAEWCSRFPVAPAEAIPDYLAELRDDAAFAGRFAPLIRAVEQGLDHVEGRIDPALRMAALEAAIELAQAGGWAEQEEAWRVRLARMTEDRAPIEDGKGPQ